MKLIDRKQKQQGTLIERMKASKSSPLDANEPLCLLTFPRLGHRAGTTDLPPSRTNQKEERGKRDKLVIVGASYEIQSTAGRETMPGRTSFKTRNRAFPGELGK